MQKVPDPPALPKPPASFSPTALSAWTGDLSRSLWRYFLDVSRRLNACQTTDELNDTISIAANPSYVGQLAFVAGEAYIAVGTSDPTDWKQITN